MPIACTVVLSACTLLFSEGDGGNTADSSNVDGEPSPDASSNSDGNLPICAIDEIGNIIAHYSLSGLEGAMEISAVNTPKLTGRSKLRNAKFLVTDVPLAVVVGPARGEQCISGEAADFGSQDRFIEIAHEPDFTVTKSLDFWFKPNTNDGYPQGLLSKDKGGSANGDFNIELASPSIVEMQLQTEGVTVGCVWTGSLKGDPDEWHHVAVSFNDRVSLFVDGATVEFNPLTDCSGEKALSNQDLSSNAHPWWWGANRGQNIEADRKYFEGAMDELYIRSVELTPADVQTIYNSFGP